ncbi:MAG: PEP-CTERM sorting domain-containing protein [Bryobacteraceae bacterium]|nr:PEP-CTERM sorting domain-containing protein [Bryobacteraceae bacterium]
MKKLLALLAFSVATASATPLLFNFSSVVGASVVFDGATDTFSFPNTGAYDFEITLSDEPSLVGLFGTIHGTFTIGAIAGGLTQTAPVTGTGIFTIDDGKGFTLTADIDMLSIFSKGTTVGMNDVGGINLYNISYGGLNKGLLELTTLGSAVATLSAQFIPPRSLKTLTAGSLVSSTSYSGTVVSNIPEPGAFALIGGGLLALGMLRRRA